jgi:hypothetical protein
MDKKVTTEKTINHWNRYKWTESQRKVLVEAINEVLAEEKKKIDSEWWGDDEKVKK